MDVSISSGAMRYIAQHHISCIVLDFVDIETGGSVGAVRDIGVEFEPPPNPKAYRYDRVQDVDVYIHRKLQITGPIRIKKQGFWKFCSLYADGLHVPL